MGSCTFLVIINGTLCCATAFVHKALAMFRSEFTPPDARGIPREDLQWLPHHAYSSADRDVEGEENMCTICISEFADGNEVRTLPCGHRFHASCVDDWLVRTPVCPMRCHEDIRDA